MICVVCDEDIGVKDKYLTCISCRKYFHLKCLSHVSQTDFEAFKSKGSAWKCTSCITMKPARSDEKPITPAKSTPELKDLSSEGESDASQSLRGDKLKSKCSKCSKGFSFNSHRPVCSKCSANFHFKCLNLDKSEYYPVQEKWLCEGCIGMNVRHKTGNPGATQQHVSLSQVAGTTGNPAVPTSAGDVTLVTLLMEMRSFRTEVTNKHRELTDNMSKHSDWVEELKVKIDDAVSQIKDFTEQLSFYRQENVNLKGQVAILMDRVNNLEQAARENVVEIQGVPMVKNENVTEIISKISTAINFEFDKGMIDNCYRLKSNRETDRSSGIILKFVRKMDMEEFIAKRKVKRNLNSRDIGFLNGEATVIYVNCSLTPEKRKLLNAARAVRREKHYTFLWVSNGRILMRKDPGSRVVVINCQSDIEKLE